MTRESKYILPIPAEPNGTDFAEWGKDIKAAAAGSLILGRNMMGSAAAGIGSTPQRDFGQKRLGPEPDGTTVDLRDHVAAHVLMSMGEDPALANPDPKTGALQAAYRSFLTGSASSFARMVTRELRRKLERPIRLRFAADMDNRRRRAAAVKSLVDPGIKVDRAMVLAGFDFQLGYVLDSLPCQTASAPPARSAGWDPGVSCGWHTSRERGPMKIIITISLWLAVWLAAPTARADAKDDFCESLQLGLRAFDAFGKSSLTQKTALALALDKLSEAQKMLLGTALEGQLERQLCPRESTGKESLARNRWNRLSRSDEKCTLASGWDQIMVHMYASFLHAEISAGFYVPQTILDDFASAGDASRRALVALGCQ